jgi:SAM-dependent methyltransferase
MTSKNYFFQNIKKKIKITTQNIEDPPAVGKVALGDLRRLTPISTDYGFDRGLPIDRYYIENFLLKYSNDIKGHALEIGENLYTSKYGGNNVLICDILDINKNNPNATVIGDLTNAPHIPSNIYDCIIITQTLQLIFDIKNAIRTSFRILKPGGVLLATIPSITQLADPGCNPLWCWGFTTVSARKLFEEVFDKEKITVDVYGNVLAAISFLEGLATQELRKEELDYFDPSYPVIITVRAIK